MLGRITVAAAIVAAVVAGLWLTRSVVGISDVSHQAPLTSLLSQGSARPSTSKPVLAPTVAPDRTSAAASATKVQPTAASPNAVATRHCGLADLQITLRHKGAGQGNTGDLLLYTNHSATECSITGYAQVTIIGPEAQIQPRESNAGYLFGTGAARQPVVELTPGATASEMIESNTVMSPPGCTAGGSIEVRFSETLTPVTLAERFGACPSTQIHPIVPGMSGTE